VVGRARLTYDGIIEKAFRSFPFFLFSSRALVLYDVSRRPFAVAGRINGLRYMLPREFYMPPVANNITRSYRFQQDSLKTVFVPKSKLRAVPNYFSITFRNVAAYQNVVTEMKPCPVQH